MAEKVKKEGEARVSSVEKTMSSPLEQTPKKKKSKEKKREKKKEKKEEEEYEFEMEDREEFQRKDFSPATKKLGVVPLRGDAKAVKRKKKSKYDMSPEDFEFVALAGRGGFGNVGISYEHSRK
jgi:dynactin complex subunit